MADFLITLCYTHLKLFLFSRKLSISDLTLFSITLRTFFFFKVLETLVFADVSLLVLSNKGYNVGWVAQLLQRLTMDWTVRDRIPVGTRFSACPDQPWGPPSLL